MIKKRALFIVVTILLLTSSLSGLEIKNGRVRLTLNERNGSFSIAYLKDLGGSVYLPLLFPEDPRTSFFNVVLNNQVLTVAENFDYKLTSEKTASGGRFIWRSKQLEIIEEFSFISSSASGMSDGVSIGLSITNISGQRVNLGLRYLFDTYLGEDGGKHFASEFHSSIDGETSFSSSALPGYILSSQNKSADSGLMIMLQGIGITRPDSVILANWKRLNDNPWNFTVNKSRNFSRPPYSINDSAAALFFNPQPLEQGATREIVLALGFFAPGGFHPGAGLQDEKLGNLVATFSGEDEEAGAAKRTPTEELSAVRELLNEIDLIIEQGQEVPEEKIILLRQLLENLKKRKTGFEE